MKIISPGKLPQEIKYRLTCPKCGTIFECLLKEATPSYDQRDGDLHSITCPLSGCKNGVWFYPSKARVEP